MKVESLVLVDVVTDTRQENEIIESLRHLLVQVGRKDARGLVNGSC